MKIRTRNAHRPHQMVLNGLFAVVPLLTSVGVLASGGGEHGAPADGHGGGHAAGGEPHVANWTNWDPEVNSHAPALAWVMLTFAIFAVIVIAAARKPLRGFLATRSDAIGSAIREADIAKKAAEAKERENAAKLKALDGEIVAMTEEFKTRGEEEKRRSIQAGERTSARLHKDAQDTMQAELDRTRRTLSAETAQMALDLAEDKIKSVMTSADETRMQKDFLAQIAAS